MTDYRASFDADIAFTNGGGMQAQGFRIDVPSSSVSTDEIGRLFVASLGLLMTEEVRLSNVEIFAEPHKGTRGGPSHRSGSAQSGRLVELGHVIRHGLVTYPGLEAPVITPYLTRADSRARYAPGTEFAMDRITLIGNTGTYLDAPFHRFADGDDLTGVRLEQCVDLPAVVVRVSGAAGGAVDSGSLAAVDVSGSAVLIHTGDAERFGTPEYAHDRHFLTRGAAELLVEQGATLVGIDALNIDDTADGTRPAHTALLAAGIPVVEHLTGLEQLPPTGASFTAVPCASRVSALFRSAHSHASRTECPGAPQPSLRCIQSGGIVATASISTRAPARAGVTERTVTAVRWSPQTVRVAA